MPKEGFLDNLEGVDPGEAAVPASTETTQDAVSSPAEAPPAADSQSPKGEAAPKKKADPANAPERPEGYVPKQALDEARNSYREELRREREARESSERRAQQILDRFYADNGMAPEDPDVYSGPADDPLAKLQWLEERETRRIQAERQQRQQQEQQTQQQAAFNEVVNRVRGEYQAAAKANPEVEGAYMALFDSFERELKAMGYRPDQITEGLRRIESEHIVWASQMGVPIGDYLINLAQARGWQPGQSKPAGSEGNGSANGQAPARDPDTGKFVQETQRIAESQERNASLSQAPGAPVKRQTWKEVAQMPEEEMWNHFRSVTKSKGAKQFDRDMGYKS